MRVQSVSQHAHPRFAIDVGGTFTDCLRIDPDGRVSTRKVLSSAVLPIHFEPSLSAVGALDPDLPTGFFSGFELHQHGRVSRVLDSEPEADHYRLRLESEGGFRAGRAFLHAPFEAPLLAVRLALRLPPAEPIPPVEIRLGTTLATNALLERRFPEPLLIVTRGFPDVLRIGFQNRPALFELAIPQPEPLTHRVIEADERLAPDGTILTPLEEAPLRDALRQAKESGVESVAVSLMHAYRNPVHEERIAQLAREAGLSSVHLSHRVAALPRYISRTETVALDAALAPVIADYVARLAEQAPAAKFQFMTSTGALVPATRFPGREAVLSGPAGGVMALEWLSRRSGQDRLVGFDMGGTSTDVSRFDGRLERRYEMELAAPGGRRFLRVVAPSLRIDTVAAGGGSICRFDGVKTVAGPESCGSRPGPACYGAGGPLAVTDLNVFLGKLPVFPFPLDREATRRRLEALREEIRVAAGHLYSLEDLAEGLTRVANASMAAPIRKLTVGRGKDPREDTLVSFGGAASQHACAVARELGMRRVVCSPFAGVFSALGIAVTHPRGFAEEAVSRQVDASFFREELPAIRARLEQRVLEELGSPEGEARWDAVIRLELHHAGQEARLVIAEPKDGDWLSAFRVAHQEQFGFVHEDRELRLFAARLEGGWVQSLPDLAAEEVWQPQYLPDETEAWFEGGWRTTPVRTRQQVRAAGVVNGPLIVVEPASTIVIEPGWQGEIDANGDLQLTIISKDADVVAREDLQRPDPVELELFENRFASIAEQMGEMLRHVAVSTNVKERLDYSCAVFDGEGGLVVNAPHIPVHLGAMETCVRCLIEDREGQWRRDAVYITNDPARGGSHLPDITVVTPLFEGDTFAPRFFVANRAHHAEIGGRTPGSMPPDATHLEEEGVVIRNFEFLPGDETSLQALRQLFTEAAFPSRAPAENLADLQAQVAANQFGRRLLGQLTAAHGTECITRYMQFLQDAARTKTTRALKRWNREASHFEDTLDDGTPIRVSIRAGADGRPILDFTGSGEVHPGNFNANLAITRSAVLYVLRLLVGEPIALNAGILAAVQLIVPSPSILDPGLLDPEPATAAGNVETSQRIVDVLLGAFGLAAASQGTMNNLLFGSNDPAAPFGFYETLAGGTGASREASGAPAVHSHMTNSRITDPEILEMRYPVLLRAWRIRENSGGDGQWRGGDGMVRQLQFLRPVTISLITSRRTVSPYGLEGGNAGLPGCNRWRPGSEEPWQPLGGCAVWEAPAGSELLVETPGGGGFGPHCGQR